MTLLKPRLDNRYFLFDPQTAQYIRFTSQTFEITLDKAKATLFAGLGLMDVHLVKRIARERGVPKRFRIYISNEHKRKLARVM
ncbi:hypothetical protein [Fischerella sp. PCC 9605]|uniref:hypothetical protein n=1 Tax=Fischerella sp. PCC 9605 TaxID=1173024 RepID=UPI00047CE76A|nr:hypothetical protein [Fischerella sp. PCC 9605]